MARALVELHGIEADPPQLARVVGRARRSAIGTWTFAGGGLVVEGGRKVGQDDAAPLLARLPFPSSWRCVVAVPHAHWGERPKAFVTLKPGQSTTEGELIAFARARIAHFKCPDTIAFGDLPKTSTGKVQKYVLREREWAGHAKRIN